MEAVEKKEWHTHQLITWMLHVQNDRQLKVLTIQPAGEKKKHPWILALHGYTSSKAEWLELDGYTKGGNIAKALVDQGYAIVAVDMDAHGDSVPTDEPVDYDDLMNNGWEEFFGHTVENLDAVINAILKSGLFDEERYGYLSYSIGGLFGFWLANHGVPFKTLVMCVPPVWKEDDDEYAPYNNLDNLTDYPMLLISVQKDEDIPLADSEWLYAQLPMANKRFISYPSGHSLPMDYVPAATEWFRQRL